MTIKFKDVTLHGKNRFLPNHAYGFEDKDAEPYFLALGWATSTNEAPEYVFPLGEVDVDPETVDNESGFLVRDIIEHGSLEKAKEAGAKPASNVAELTPQDVVVENAAG